MPNFSQSDVTNGANVVPRAVGTPSSDGMVEDRSGWGREGVGGELQPHVAGSGGFGHLRTGSAVTLGSTSEVATSAVEPEPCEE